MTYKRHKYFNINFYNFINILIGNYKNIIFSRKNKCQTTLVKRMVNHSLFINSITGLFILIKMDEKIVPLKCFERKFFNKYNS